MPSPGASSSSWTPGELKAQASFKDTAKLQLKQMMACGAESDAAELELMDRLLHHGASEKACSAARASPQLQHVVSVTGFTPTQAAKTILLKEEIGHLRRQGHGTEGLIATLQKRLRFQPSSRSDENGPQAPLQPQQKKLKRNDEGHDFRWPPLPDSPRSLRGGLPDVRRSAKKRRPAEDGVVSPPKKPKPRSKPCD